MKNQIKEHIEVLMISEGMKKLKDFKEDEEGFGKFIPLEIFQNSLKNPDKIKQGKKSRRDGAKFELKIRADLEAKGLIVDRWSNQVDLELNKLVKAKSNRFNMRTCGFPDFICFQESSSGIYQVWGIEVKSNGKLSKTEKEKCQWLLKNNIFGKIFVASKEGTGVKYEEVQKS